MKTWQAVAFGLLVGLLLSAAVLLVAFPPRGEPIILSTPLPPPMVMVFVDGAVQNPGVYSLPPQSRVSDAIDAAGGLLPSANTTNLNLAAKISDAEKIMVATIKETPVSKSTNMGTKSQQVDIPTEIPGFPININTASIEELQNLPGIGAVKANAIVIYRQEHGPFKKITDLLNVPGIGQGILSSIQELITTGDIP